MSRKQVYINILIICSGFAFLAYYLHIPVLYILPLLIAACLINIKLAVFIVNAWLLLGKKIGYINGILWLSVMYFLLLWPIAIIKKWVQYKPKQITCTWKDAAPITDFKRPF